MRESVAAYILCPHMSLFPIYISAFLIYYVIYIVGLLYWLLRYYVSFILLSLSISSIFSLHWTSADFTCYVFPMLVSPTLSCTQADMHTTFPIWAFSLLYPLIVRQLLALLEASSHVLKDSVSADW